MNIKLVYIFLLVTSFSFSQSGKLKKADNFYNKVAYAEAALLYTELLGSEVDSPKLKSKLANCYYQTGETSKSEEVYQSYIDETALPADIYNYAQSLKENGKYNESDTWMEKFHSVTKDDSRGKQFIERKTYLEEINAQGTYFSINHLKVNSKDAEFGGYPGRGKEVYFVSNRKKRISIQRFHSYNNKQFLDLYVGNNENNEIENAEFQSRKVNTKYHEGPLCFSPDGKMVYFTRNNISSGQKRRDEKGIQNLKLYSSEVDEEGNWKKEKELEINSKDFSVGHPTISADGKTIYFASNMPGGFGGVDLYKMSVNSDGSFGPVENLGAKINTEGQEMFPWMSEDGLLFFSSDGHIGLGGLDVFVVIPKKDGSFNKLMNVGKPVNSNRDDFSFIMNKDNVSGFVSSNRDTGSGDDDIYSFMLLKPLKVNLIVQGVATDKRSNEILAGAKIDLIDQDGNIISSVITDSKGAYEFGLEPELNYNITASNEDYFDGNTSFSTVSLPDGTEVLVENVNLEKDPGLSLFALISDAKTKKPIEKVQLLITDNMTGKTETFITEMNGEFMKPLIDKKLNDRGSYNFAISCEGYFPKTVTYNTVFDKEGQYDVNAIIDMTLDPMVSDLRDLISINPINFDLGKWNIRTDAKIELDKIVEVMNKYPKMVVELGSHTDCRASKGFNMKLSDKRAKSSAKYIKSKITNPDRIYGKGYGESILLNGCECEGSVKSDCSEEEHEKNRRTEFKVISVGDPNVGVQKKDPSEI